MTDDAAQRLADAEEHRRDYISIMKAAGEIGVPFTLGLTVFFTNLVLANGWWSLLAGVITYVVVFLIVKTFFSH